MPAHKLDARQFDAVLFDLDGVITRTAAVHAAAWKKLFDHYLQARAQHTGTVYFLEALNQQGVQVYDTTVAFIQQAKTQGLKVAVISSSKNCVHVLKSAGRLALFDARVDGVASERLGLPGKP
jgi:beta-phosphoglucomutase-like phosphatase (HAD superfamily)